MVKARNFHLSITFRFFRSFFPPFFLILCFCFLVFSFPLLLFFLVLLHLFYLLCALPFSSASVNSFVLLRTTQELRYPKTSSRRTLKSLVQIHIIHNSRVQNAKELPFRYSMIGVQRKMEQKGFRSLEGAFRGSVIHK